MTVKYLFLMTNDSFFIFIINNSKHSWTQKNISIPRFFMNKKNAYLLFSIIDLEENNNKMNDNKRKFKKKEKYVKKLEHTHK